LNVIGNNLAREGTDIVCMDTLVINVSGANPITIPLEAIPANPSLQYDSQVDFGCILNASGYDAAEKSPEAGSFWIIKKVKVRNVGLRDTKCSDATGSIPFVFRLGSW
jgi:hypothetical protein